jgi:hypothetical protein
MKRHIQALTLTISLITLSMSAFGSQEENLQLEPCINGSVSASGLYETQALEDAANLKIAQKLGKLD